MLAATITDRGISMAADAAFSTMANGIRTIQPYKQYVNENFYPQPWAFTAQDGTSKNPGAIALNVGFIPLMGFCSKKSNWNNIGFARSWDCFTYNSSSSAFIRYKTDGGNTNVLLKSDGTVAFPVPWWDGGAPYIVVIVGYQA